ncbi:MAG: TIGR04282 family arsenosugar biosynthesis glycosyltransferase [Verrucomicrobiota bacterium]
MKAQGSSIRLVIFVKAPRLGQVKSRLAAGIGESAACAAYKRMVEQLMENLQGLENVEIRFAPDEGEDELRKWLGGKYDFRRQRSGDLGERLHRAFQENFNPGHERVVVIGSDCPYVTKADIESAANSLATHDVVLGPATDGGYWLIGLSEPQPALFEDIPWSTEAVLETTLCRIRSENLSIYRLRTLDDIDVAEDWGKFLNRL